MSHLPRIAAKFVIADTGETTEHEFQDVEKFLESIHINAAMSSLTFGRAISPRGMPKMDGDNMTWSLHFEDNGALYCSISATRRFAH